MTVLNRYQQSLELTRLDNAKRISHFLIEAVEAGRIDPTSARKTLSATHFLLEDLTGALQSCLHCDAFAAELYASIFVALHKTEPKKYPTGFKHQDHLFEFHQLILRLGVWLKDTSTSYPLGMEEHVRVKNFLTNLLREEESRTPGLPA